MSEVETQTPGQTTNTPGTEPNKSGEGNTPNTPNQNATPAAAAPSTNAADTPKPDANSAESAPPPKVVPETYDLKLSENSPLDSDALTKLAAEAKALGLSQEEAADFVKVREEDVTDFIKQRKDAWLNQSKADPEIGGTKLAENVVVANRAIEKYASPALKSELAKTGYGSHPEMVRMFARIGREMADDRAILPGAQTGNTMPVTEIFYPKKQEGA